MARGRPMRTRRLQGATWLGQASEAAPALSGRRVRAMGPVIARGRSRLVVLSVYGRWEAGITGRYPRRGRRTAGRHYLGWRGLTVPRVTLARDPGGAVAFLRTSYGGAGPIRAVTVEDT